MPAKPGRPSALQRLPLGMLVQIINDKAAPGDDLLTPGPDQVERALDQLRRDALATQGPRRLGVGDDDSTIRQPVVGEGRRPADIHLEALQRRIVTDCGDHLV